MSYISTKVIKGKKYRYATKSIRLPDGTTKKFYRLVSSKNTSSLEDYFSSKEKAAYVKFALSSFTADRVFTTDVITKIEEMRVDYKHLIKKLSKPDLKDMLDRFTVNFTYDSNAIEGNSLTLKDVNIVINENSSIKGKELREIYETKNSRSVMDMVIRKRFDISHKDIIKMHKILMKDIDERTGYKKVPNYIIGRRIHTSAPEKVPNEMEALISFYKGAVGRMHPLQLASHFHGRFERIHPFSDGNGRVGRFLVNVILIKSNYFPLIIRKTRRESYMSSLEAFDFNNKIKLERFMVDRYKETFRSFFQVYVKYLRPRSE
ncbi:MAG: Fic family protein [Candidatus Micrarchaeota archaeon]|nr:Fic family protein [Candidatus Micrarchaeota archaeon]